MTTETAMTFGTRRDSRPSPLAAELLPVIVGAVFYLLLLLSGDKLLNDPDSYWHVVLGGWMAEHHAIPTSDTFSFTFTGTPWIAMEWLSQLAYAGAYAIGGWTGMVALAAGAVALAFALLARFLLDVLKPPQALVLVAFAFLLAAPHVVARPHALALPVMVAWVAGLARANDEGRAPSLFLLPLMVLWANLHGGFTLGILLVGAIGLDAIVSAAAAERMRVAGQWVGFGLLALAAGCVTPFGPQSVLSTVRVLSLGPALSIISEWRAADFSHFGGLEAYLMLGLGFALWRGISLPPVRILTLLGLLHLALSAGRNGEILGLLAPIVVAGSLVNQLRFLRAETRPRSEGRSLAIAATGVGLLAAATFALAPVLKPAPNPRITPAGAVAAIKQAKAGRVLNDYDFGGYMVYSGVPTFIDGRTEIFGGAFLARHLHAVTLADLNDFVRLLDDFRVDATLLSPRTAAVAFLDRLPGWRRLYADDIAVAHIRQ